MKRRKPRRKSEGPRAMGLVPFMNLILILIPALLVSASFAQVAVIEGAQPVPELGCETGPEASTGPDHFRVWLHVGDRGLDLRFALGHHLQERPFLPRIEGVLPLELLAKELRELKAGDPGARQLTLSADTEIPYKELVQVMDATREDGAGPLFPDLALTPSP